MSKVALITLHTVSNYGSCLQTFATQKIFESLGWEVEVIDYYRADNLPEYAVEKAFMGRRMQKFQGVWDRAPWLKRLLSIPMGQLLSVKESLLIILGVSTLIFLSACIVPLMNLNLIRL